MSDMTAKKLFGMICAEYKRTHKPVPRSYVLVMCNGNSKMRDSLIGELIMFGVITSDITGYIPKV